MAEDRGDQVDRADGSRWALGAQEGGYFAIGLIFFVLGLSGAATGDTSRTAFLALGVVFLALFAAGASKGDKGREGGGSSEAAAVDGDAGGGADGRAGGGGD